MSLFRDFLFEDFSRQLIASPIIVLLAFCNHAREMSKNSELEELLRRELNTSTLRPAGRSGRGCISDGCTYETEYGRVFVKINRKQEAQLMFEGEYASLQALSAMQEVKVPEPTKVVKLEDGGAIFVMENLEITGRLSGQSGVLGQQLARLHLKNEEIAQMELKQEKYVHKGQQIKAVHNFGFHTSTCCGYIPQDNTWTYTWQEFFARKIEQQISMLESEYGDREARDLWSQLLPRLSQLFDGLGEIKPALLHGDLWSGNVAEDKNGPVIFDPASFYGHAEYDLSISSLFGGFGQQFFKSYFSIIPKAPGYHERLELYKLFHYLNHWNHFGEAYRESSLGALRAVVKCVSM